MPRQIWNEGRVVGYSAYEVYVKHALSVDPDHEPATEKEWLASMMAMFIYASSNWGRFSWPSI